jgi:hypothetical protein
MLAVDNRQQQSSACRANNALLRGAWSAHLGVISSHLPSRPLRFGIERILLLRANETQSDISGLHTLEKHRRT